MVAVTNPGLLLTNTDLTITSPSTSVKTLLKLITLFSASSSTLTSVIGLRTVGGLSTAPTLTTKVSSTVLPLDVPRIVRLAIPNLLSW